MRLAHILSETTFWVFWAIFGTAVRVAFRVRVEGEALPAGPCVLVANHTSYLDPVVLGAVIRRRVAFLTNASICSKPTLGWFLRWTHSIPVHARGRNRDAMRRARDVLAKGGVLGVFPEGGISRDGGLLLGNPGAVALALAGGVPIVPVGLLGASAALPPWSALPRPRQVVVRVGAPLPTLGADVSEEGRRARLRVVTRQVMDAIAELTDQVSRERAVESSGPTVR